MTTQPHPLGWSIEPLGAALGARVIGPDLRAPIDDATATALVDLLLEHLVLAIPDQNLDPDSHVALGRLFGEPLIHPYLEAIEGHPEILTVIKEPTDVATFGGEHWHADITFINPPSSVSLLQALQLPDRGGDTLYANQYQAYESLSPTMQAMLNDLNAVHLYPGKSEDEPGAVAIHPVVRVHPLTGRKALFVNPAFVVRFEGMTEHESRGLLDTLFEHQVRHEFCIRMPWSDGMLAIWDNRAVLHHALNDYPGQRRALQRVTVMEVLDKA